jgi:hypothetical protein
MIITLDLVLLLIALGCFVASACGVASRVNLLAVGLALFTVTLLTPP